MYFKPKISDVQLQYVRTTLMQAQDSVNLVNTTVKPDVFFKRLNFLLDLILRLQPYERYGIFKNGLPSEDYRRIITNLEATVNDFIDRAIEKNKQEIAALKRSASKEKHYYDFTASLISAFDCAHTFWAGDRGFPHYDGALFTKANYDRVQRIFNSDFDVDPYGITKLRTLDPAQAPANSTPEQPAQKPMAPEEYQTMRDYESQWLESHYDFNSAEGINRIPLVKDLRCPKTNGVTGEVYYYLRHKAYEHEKAGNIDLALQCLRKSNALLKLNCCYSKEEFYPLVKMLARDGRVEEAEREKDKIDRYCADAITKIQMKQLHKMQDDLGTDLVIMSAHGSVCPECAKYQGRVYSVSGKSKLFPKVPYFFKEGCVHSGCGHVFFPYIHGVNDPDLEYTLSVHPLKNKEYGKNIVIFSNRPFVDDRTDDVKEQAALVCKKQEEEREKQQYYEEHMIEVEAKRGQEARDYRWLQENIPGKCPKSVTGYRRMKTQNTKNYQALKQFAAEHGREI